MNLQPTAVRPWRLSRFDVPRNGIHSHSGESPVRQERARMKDCESVAHVRWECKYHVVLIPKCRAIAP
jgi:hypothetical protein